MYDTASKALESFARISGGAGSSSSSSTSSRQHQQLRLEGQAGEQQQGQQLQAQQQQQLQQFQQQQQQQLQQFQQQQQQQFQQQPQLQQLQQLQQFQQFQLPPPRPRGGLAGGGEVGSGRRGLDNALFSFLAPLPPPRPAPEWGTSHRHFRSQATRVPFDRGEIDYLQAMLEANPHFLTSGRMAAMALAHIRQDRAARAIFHVRHVLNTTRLKTGFAALERAKAAARAGDPWGSDNDDDDVDGDDAGVDDSPPPANLNSRLRFFND